MELIILLLIIYFVYKKTNPFMYRKLNLLLKTQHFSNIKKDTLSGNIKIITADSHGENHLFVISKDNYILSTTDIDNIYDYAKRLHYHNIIIVVNLMLFPNSILRKIKEYGIQIWDNKKINSLLTSQQPTSVLQTSDVSNDKCIIDPSKFEPIQPYKSTWKNIFKKPDRL